jgi:hypothetical protein
MVRLSPSIAICALLWGVANVAAALLPNPPNPPKASTCRFATKYTRQSIIQNPSAFEQDVIFWEGMFHQNNVSYNALNGMTFDGTLLDPITGVHNVDGLHTFSAASKESLHMMLLAHVVQGNPSAAKWILAAHGGGSDVETARTLAISILNTKWATYSTFNQTYPGFGGFLPWYVDWSIIGPEQAK